MSEIRDESGSNVLTTEDQIAERDTFAFRYINDLIAHLNAGDLDASEHSLRRHADAELVTNAASLHFALTRVGSEVPLGDLTTPRHPALLLPLPSPATKQPQTCRLSCRFCDKRQACSAKSGGRRPPTVNPDLLSAGTRLRHRS